MKRLSKEEFLEKYGELITEDQINNLSFDYFNQEYPNKTRLPKEDLKFLFIDLNLAAIEIAELTGTTKAKVTTSLQAHTIRKTKQQEQKVRERRCLKFYGVSNISLVDGVREKAKQTCKTRFGEEYFAKTQEFKKKYIQHNLDTFGVENYAKTQECKDKMKQTCLEKYGTEVYFQAEQFKQKSKKTCLEKYGTEQYIQSSNFREKSKNTMLDKFGVEYAGQVPELQMKARKTRKETGSFKKVSKPEIYAFKKLQTKFEDVDYQHWDERYPFECDFYIPKYDLFIELQIYQGHGKRPFNPNSLIDQQKVKEWATKYEEINYKGEKKKQYKDYIKTWTVKDPEKRETAKKNNLNWLEFFTLKEFDEWFDTLN